MTDYEHAYGSDRAYFGAGPNRLLMDHVDLVPAGSSVLDVGVGQGRNALPLDKVRSWTAPGGLLLLTAWHVDDPRYQQTSQSCEPLGRHSYRTESGTVRSYLERGEILQLLHLSNGARAISRGTAAGRRRHLGLPARRLMRAGPCATARSATTRPSRAHRRSSAPN